MHEDVDVVPEDLGKGPPRPQLLLLRVVVVGERFDLHGRAIPQDNDLQKSIFPIFFYPVIEGSIL